jgi:tripartite-type tricarboxylate transporter receptor subunit TctC
VPKGTTPAQLASFLQSEIAKWGPVINDAKIKLDN